MSILYVLLVILPVRGGDTFSSQVFQTKAACETAAVWVKDSVSEL